VQHVRVSRAPRGQLCIRNKKGAMVKVGRTARQLHLLSRCPQQVAANLQKVIHVLVGLLIQRTSCQLLLWNAGFGFVCFDSKTIPSHRSSVIHRLQQFFWDTDRLHPDTGCILRILVSIAQNQHSSYSMSSSRNNDESCHLGV